MAITELDISNAVNLLAIRIPAENHWFYFLHKTLELDAYLVPNLFPAPGERLLYWEYQPIEHTA